MTCGGADAGGRSDVRDVLPVRRDDQRSARRECSREAGRDEEVRVDDIGMEGACLAPGIAEESDVTGASRRCGSRSPRVRSRGRARPIRPRGSRRRPRGPGHSALGTSVRREGSACRAAIVTPASSRWLPARDLQDSEAHLVGRPLAPEDVAPRRLRHAVATVEALAHVMPAGDPNDVTGLRLDRIGERVGVLPVGSPSAGCREASSPVESRIQLELDRRLRRADACGLLRCRWSYRRRDAPVSSSRRHSPRGGGTPRRRMRRPAGANAALVPTSSRDPREPHVPVAELPPSRSSCKRARRGRASAPSGAA